MENIEEFATLKAIGGSRRFLAGVIVGLIGIEILGDGVIVEVVQVVGELFLDGRVLGAELLFTAIVGGVAPASPAFGHFRPLP